MTTFNVSRFAESIISSVASGIQRIGPTVAAPQPYLGLVRVTGSDCQAKGAHIELIILSGVQDCGDPVRRVSF